MKRAPQRSRAMRRWVVGIGFGALFLYALNAPATTRQGVNFVVSTTRVPTYVKILDFLHRDAQYRLLANQITAGITGDEARALAVFRWTREHIAATPEDWPIVDDHVLHIIIRGHGIDDQMADVFTTLLTYAKVPAFWKPVKLTHNGPTLILSFVNVDGRWTMFDVAHHVIFADAQGRLMNVETLITSPSLGDAIAGDVMPWGVPYSRYLVLLQPFTVPDVLRAEQQMPWPRLRDEVRQLIRGRG